MNEIKDKILKLEEDIKLKQNSIDKLNGEIWELRKLIKENEPNYCRKKRDIKGVDCSHLCTYGAADIKCKYLEYDYQNLCSYRKTVFFQTKTGDLMVHFCQNKKAYLYSSYE